jgi:hypothetical protein
MLRVPDQAAASGFGVFGCATILEAGIVAPSSLPCRTTAIASSLDAALMAAIQRRSDFALSSAFIDAPADRYR